jgi:UDP-N-acetylglucosamine--N-acetylmuramyl-(pentapeptide) pyrophosphoryl-undecaprenol N-acetylglucosamine transferase
MEAYRAAFDDVSLYFIGCSGGFESQMVPARGFELKMIPGSPYARQGPAGKARSIVEFGRGILHARRLLRSNETRLVIGLGGYACAGAIMAARSLGLGTVIHEANAVPGIANRLAGRLADRVCVGWEDAYSGISGVSVSVTGNPILREIVDAGSSPRDGEGPRHVLVTGGSEGSRFLNDHAPALLAQVVASGIQLDVRHQTGAGSAVRVRRMYAEAGIPAQVEDFIGDMAGAYVLAHFAIASAGALTLSELSAAGVPALVLPTRAVADAHQDANAMVYAQQTGSIWTTEQDWNPDALADRIGGLLRNPSAWRDQAERARSIARPEAAGNVVAACEELMRNRW